MKRIGILMIVVLAAVASASDAQILEQRKPGLWEIQYTAQDSAHAGEQAQMAQKLASMPPEQRAKMEAYLKERGSGMTLGPGGVPTMVMRFCLTPQDVADESGHTFMKGLSRNGACEPHVVARSASEVHVHAVCRSDNGATSELDARIYDVSADHYIVDISGKGPRGDVHMEQKARRLSGDCKGAAY